MYSLDPEKKELRKTGNERSDCIQGTIFDIQRYCVHDGPGVRTVVFMKGCPLNCVWCCNPESISPKPELMVFNSSCIGCGLCIKSCPKGALCLEEGKIIINRAKCDICGICTEACPTESIQMRGYSIELKELTEEILKDEPFFRNSGGGVTLSGGEPTAQPEFAAALLAKLNSKGIHTAIETNGYANWPVLKSLVRQSDLILFDIKHLNPLKHFEYTGVTNEQILYNLNQIVSEKKQIIIRMPIIPGVNYHLSHLKETAKYLKTLNGSIEEVHLLPYHRLGVQKYAKLGKSYPLNDVEPLTPNEIEHISNLFDAQKFRIKIGG